ncbi:MAG: LysM peptidoglycan-binding domain-containing protein [Anaerolineae bacterium]|nr:LysM peptidoglycan-binding domain-containing protein [Gemmatimonadaceae bacterium]
MPFRRALSLAALGTALSAPVAMSAQDDVSGRSHVVRSGDTLWDLARVYLSDPFQWPEIYRVNDEVVEDPHWIYPGETLSIPGDEPIAMVQAVAPSNTTIFSRARVERPAIVAAVQTYQAPVTSEPNGVREGEVYAAPWVERIGGPEGQGELLERAAESVISQAAEGKWLQVQDRAYVKLPAGSGARRGDRYVIVRLGPAVGANGQIAIPTGIVEVEDDEKGDVPIVRVVRQFDAITVGQAIIPLQRFPIPDKATPVQKVLGVRTSVVWISSEAVLPSVQHYLVLAATLKDGVAIGDQFTLLRPRVRLDNGSVLPEEPLALAQAVRVTDRGTTVILIDQRHPSISVGTAARLTAKMP